MLYTRLPVSRSDAYIVNVALAVAPVPIIAVFADTSTAKAESNVVPPTAKSSAPSVKYVIPVPSVHIALAPAIESKDTHDALSSSLYSISPVVAFVLSPGSFVYVKTPSQKILVSFVVVSRYK